MSGTEPSAARRCEDGGLCEGCDVCQRTPSAVKCKKCGGTGFVRAFGEAGEFGATKCCPECDGHEAVDFLPGNYFGFGYGVRW